MLDEQDHEQEQKESGIQANDEEDQADAGEVAKVSSGNVQAHLPPGVQLRYEQDDPPDGHSDEIGDEEDKSKDRDKAPDHEEDHEERSVQDEEQRHQKLAPGFRGELGGAEDSGRNDHGQDQIEQ